MHSLPTDMGNPFELAYIKTLSVLRNDQSELLLEGGKNTNQVFTIYLKCRI